MKRIPYTNTTDAAAYVAGILIQPGETRMVEALQLAEPAPMPATKPAPSAPVPVLLDILDGSVKDITAALAELSAAQLDELETAEQNGKTRKGVLEAIAAARIELAKGSGDAPAE